ncbi:MAG TPA: aldehyde dehydrogenase family protein, partial [Candidatus Limnocylindria bacterium]|nr:aldehyde dehydrogenase family protein [Candidatus Limnocylindria bacterium]
SDPRLPFGGVKRSGYGRELAAAGIREFSNVRTFWVQPSDAEPPAVLTGGERGSGKGWYYRPTVLADVTEDMPVFKEETFGPVAAVLRTRDADDAVRLANESAYGLGANIWTRDLALGEALARRIESGSVFVNGMVASDPRLPFGGVKRSGYGRELSSYGIKEFVNIQTIWIGSGAQTTPAPKAE